MNQSTAYIMRVSLIVALGGFLMGFDASVISGVIKFIEVEFSLSKLQIGWAVSSLTLTSTLAMLTAGPLSDRFGRRQILRWSGILYAISAVLSAVAPTFDILVIARMIGGFGVGASLIIAPMYIAEISPAAIRGRMVSFNQLNIVTGISVAFFSNFLLLRWGSSGSELASWLGVDAYTWRWMLGIEALPAIAYFLVLFLVPRSPRWLVMKGEFDEAMTVMQKTVGDNAAETLQEVKQSLTADADKPTSKVSVLLGKPMRLVLIISVVIAAVQQLTGINAVFFYAPTIFEQTGLGTDASFMQAILVGLINLVFTVVAMLLIDRAGRKSLLIAGLSGIIISMGILTYGFGQATFTLQEEAGTVWPEGITQAEMQPLLGQTFGSDKAFKLALADTLGAEKAAQHEEFMVKKAIDIQPGLVLLGILLFVASFAVSLGPVMWVLFSELFPNHIRGVAISVAGGVNSAASFLVQLVFPWELANLGSAFTFGLFGVFALIGLVVTLAIIPETKGRSLEELEKILIKTEK